MSTMCNVEVAGAIAIATGGSAQPGGSIPGTVNVAVHFNFNSQCWARHSVIQKRWSQGMWS
jgi:hypothetical protein